MAIVQVEWLQRVNGRYPGLVENIEQTPYIDALASQRRLRILHVVPEPEWTAPDPILGVFVPVLDGGGDLSSPDDTEAPSEPVSTEAESLSESELLGLAVPKPRAPRKPKPVLPESLDEVVGLVVE